MQLHFGQDLSCTSKFYDLKNNLGNVFLVHSGPLQPKDHLKYLGWQVCRTKLAQNVFLGARTFSRKMPPMFSHNFFEPLFCGSSAKFPPNFPQNSSAKKNKKNSLMSFCRRAGRRNTQILQNEKAMRSSETHSRHWQDIPVSATGILLLLAARKHREIAFCPGACRSLSKRAPQA